MIKMISDLLAQLLMVRSNNCVFYYYTQIVSMQAANIRDRRSIRTATTPAECRARCNEMVAPAIARISSQRSLLESVYQSIGRSDLVGAVRSSTAGRIRALRRTARRCRRRCTTIVSVICKSISDYVGYSSRQACFHDIL